MCVQCPLSFVKFLHLFEEAVILVYLHGVYECLKHIIRVEGAKKSFYLLCCKYFVRGHNDIFYVCTIIMIMNSLFVSFNTRQNVKESALHVLQNLIMFGQ